MTRKEDGNTFPRKTPSVNQSKNKNFQHASTKYNAVLEVRYLYERLEHKAYLYNPLLIINVYMLYTQHC